MLEAVIHHLTRFCATSKDAGECAAELRADKDELERRLERLETRLVTLEERAEDRHANPLAR